ncbi:MAG: site-specific DNA-methyltransferase [Bacteroidales bacterium]
MNTVQKFQDLLKKLFQFETSDLDFGIYRILNFKRDLIEKFIQEDLKNKVESAFAKHKDERLININQRFEKAKEEIIKNLGKDAFTSTGELKEEFKTTPLGRDFLTINAQKEEAEAVDEIKLQVFNDLYNFFSRYYEEGDFVPQYRYSIKGYKYAIPYNGEEVKLYWANNEQYYTKTGLLFRDYTFKASDFKVVFRTVSAKEELGSNKATKERFFVLDDEKPIELNDKTLIIRFQYRELTEKEVKDYEIEGGSNTAKQEKINQKSYDELINKIEDLYLKNKILIENKNDKPLLLYQISRFTAKNTRDYFIHKNLKKFLSEQLDYFIKSEVLSIETLEKEKFLDKHITRAKMVRAIGETIIDFLSQIEDFQKRLWEKKKFVIKTEYVITLDKIKEYAGEEFLESIIETILQNKEQVKEWEELGFGKIERKEDLYINSNLLVKEYKKLPIDTRYFSQEFKEKLLEGLTKNNDLDDILDGLFIKSENWQALNTILNKYKEKVQTIYIDPPYNTGSDEFLYRDRYQHSSWLTMMENRLSLAKELMKDDGVIFVSIDDREQEKIKILLSYIFGYDRFLAQIVRDIPDGTNLPTKGGIKVSTEYVLAYYNNTIPLNNDISSYSAFKKYISGDMSDIIETRLTKRGNPKREIKFPAGIGREDIRVNKIIKEGNYINPSSKEKIFVKKGDLIIENGILKKDVVLEAEWSMPVVLEKLFKGEQVYDDNGQQYKYIFFNKNGIPYIVKERNKSLIPSYLNIKNEKDALFIHILGYNESPKEATIKPVPLIEILTSLYSKKDSIILDFFGGSGTTAHAVMKLNKEDGGRRKFILVEMADYFDTIVIPRIKKVAYSFNWKDGKPQDTDGIGVFFKYQILEQYEDTLDNIELKENQKALELFKDEYLLKYFLDYETRESPYLLNIDLLKNHFAYKLKANLSEVGEPQEMVIDIPETFNYLVGLKVKRIKTRNNKRKYLFILGEKEGKNIAIVWKEYSDNWTDKDFKEDKEFIIKELTDWKPHIVYVNGQSILTPKEWEVRYIEPEFKKLMEG